MPNYGRLYDRRWYNTETSKCEKRHWTLFRWQDFLCIQCPCLKLVQWTQRSIVDHWMGEACFQRRPFKPLVEGSSPSALITPRYGGLFCELAICGGFCGSFFDISVKIRGLLCIYGSCPMYSTWIKLACQRQSTRVKIGLDYGPDGV